MWLRFFKAAPKYALALAILLVSAGIFTAWWMLRSPLTNDPGKQPETQADDKRQAIANKTKTLPEKIGWLALVGPDLYDISTGELVFENWLRGMVPEKLFYQKEHNRLMALTERGVIRFALDGTPDAVMGENAVPSFTHDGKQAIYVKDGDVWIAETDWGEFKLVNERQVTKIGQFNPAFFAANVVLRSNKAIIVRQQGRPLRISLLTGDIEPVNLPLSDLAKRRSPDGRFLVGDEPRNIYAVDVEAPEAYNFPQASRDRLVDYQWLDNNRCAFIVGGKGVALYNREKNRIEEVCPLPFSCNKMAGPSPDGRFVLCAARQGIVIVDTQQKTTENFGTPAQHFEWITNDTLIYARDVPDLSVRGTWIKTMGSAERQIIADPYTFGRDGIGAVGVMREVGIVMSATKSSLFRIKSDGSQLREMANLSKPANRLQAVESWGH